MSVRRTALWLGASALLVGGAVFALTSAAAPPPNATPVLPDVPRPIVFAHRGGAEEGPESTVATMLAVLKRDPKVGMELDVRASRDGHIVVIHDATVDRTTNGSGRVADLDLAAIQALDAGHCALADPERGTGGGTARKSACRSAAPSDRFPARNRGYRIPTLHEVLAALPRTTPLAIEVKEAGFEEQFCELILRSGRGGRLIVGSGNDDVAARLRACMPPGFAVHYFPKWAALRLAAGSRINAGPGTLDYQVFAAPQRVGGVALNSQGLIADLHRLGIFAMYFTIDDEADMERLFARGADAIITDLPGLAGRVRDRLPALPRHR